MRYRDQMHSQGSHITTLRMVIGVLCLVIVVLWNSWSNARDSQRVHIPPDIRNGANLAFNEIHPANVYAFTSYILQQLNHWAADGSKEYPENIYALATYFTPTFRSQLIAKMELSSKQGELSDRSIFKPKDGFDSSRHCFGA